MRCGSRSGSASTIAPTAAARVRICRCGTRELIRCPQVPTTLPTLDELIGLDGVDERQRRRRICSGCTARRPRAAGQVFTLHAELEGMRLRPVLEQLLVGLEGAGLCARPGARARTMRCEPLALPRCEVAARERSRPQRHAARAGRRVPRRRRPRRGRMSDPQRASHGATARWLGKKVADFTAPATDGTFHLVRSHAASRSCCTSIPRTTRPAARPRARQFRDLHEQFAKAGAVVVGVSRDSVKSHRSSRRRWGFRSS